MDECEGETGLTIFLCFFEFFLEPGLALLSTELAFYFLCESKDGLLAFFHGVIRVEKVVCGFLAETCEDGTDAADALCSHSVDITVEWACVGEGWAGSKELEEIGREEMGAGHERERTNKGQQ